MGGASYPVMMGDRGRVVLPVSLRKRLRLEPGTPMVMIETDLGVVLTTREQLKRLVRSQLRGLDLVAELLADRSRAAADDAA